MVGYTGALLDIWENQTAKLLYNFYNSNKEVYPHEKAENKLSFVFNFIYFWGCGKGYYAARTGPFPFDRTCVICPRGSYSDTDTASRCIQCPSGCTTAQEGSTNISHCQGGK